MLARNVIASARRGVTGVRAFKPPSNGFASRRNAGTFGKIMEYSPDFAWKHSFWKIHAGWSVVVVAGMCVYSGYINPDTDSKSWPERVVCLAPQAALFGLAPTYCTYFPVMGVCTLAAFPVVILMARELDKCRAACFKDTRTGVQKASVPSPEHEPEHEPDGAEFDPTARADA